MMDNKILSRFQNLCSKREYCSSELYPKVLKALDGDEAAAAETMNALREDKFLSDGRYAEAFARDKSALTGWGPVKIRFALRAKRIPEDAISLALEQIDASKAEEKLLRLVQAKNRTLEGDPQRRLKLIRFALSRGYDYDQVEKVIQEL